MNITGISPLWITLLSFLITVETGIGTGNVKLDNVFPHEWIPWIIGWSGFLAFIGGALMTALTTLQSAKPGLLVKDQTAVKSIMFAAIAIGAMFMFSASAHAQIKVKLPQISGDVAADTRANLGIDQPTKMTGNLHKDAQALWDKIVAASDADLRYASQLAANANTPSSLVRKQCWDAIVAINEQANGLNLKDANGTLIPQPDPKLFTQIEQAAEVLDALSPQGKLFTSCAGAAQLAQTGVLQFVNAAITGVAGMAKIVPIPGL